MLKISYFVCIKIMIYNSKKRRNKVVKEKVVIGYSVMCVCLMIVIMIVNIISQLVG